MSEGEDATRRSYNRVAANYARLFNNELDHKPLERQLLADFMPGAAGPIGDLGCGPGHIAAYICAQGHEVIGVDLSDEMVAEAQRLHPDITFIQADMRQLPFADAALTGIVALYSLIHIPEDEIPAVMQEIWRVLRPQGEVLVGFHRGTEVRHFADWWGEAVDLDFRFFTTQSMTDWLTQAGFVIHAISEREPYPEVEVQTQRAYIRAGKPR